MKYTTPIIVFITLAIGYGVLFVTRNTTKQEVISPNPLFEYYSSSDFPSDMQTIHIDLGYLPDIQFAPFYVGMEKVFFEDKNITLDVSNTLSPTIAETLDSGEFDIAVMDADTFVFAVEQGMNLVGVMPYYEISPISIMSLSESHIDKPQDLASKKIGVPYLGGSSYYAFSQYAKVMGLDAGSYEIVPVGYTLNESLMAGEVDAILGYLNNEGSFLEHQKIDFSSLPLGNFTTSNQEYWFAGPIIVANRDYANKNPEAVGAFVEGLKESKNFVIDHPDDAVNISSPYIGFDNTQEAIKEERYRMNATASYFLPLDKSVSYETILMNTIKAIELETGEKFISPSIAHFLRGQNDSI